MLTKKKRKMVVNQYFLQSKTQNPQDCEDEIVITEHFAAIIDGATSKTVTLYDGLTPGKKAGVLIAEAIQFLPYDCTALEAVELLTNKIAEYYHKKQIFKKVKENSTEKITASVIIFSQFRREVWLVGDCQALAGENLITNHKILDEIVAQLRSAFLRIEINKGKSIEELMNYDTGREFVMPIIKSLMSLQNASYFPYNTAVIDGFKVDTQQILITKITDNQLVLASDGYPHLFSTLEKTEEYLHTILQKDPLLFSEYLSTKGLKRGNLSFDDRAYLKIIL